MKATLKTSRKVLVIVVASVILLATLLLSTYSMAVGTMASINSEMSSTLSTFENKVIRAVNVTTLAVDLDRDMINGSDYLVRLMFEEYEDVQQAVDALTRDSFHAYLIAPDGRITRSESAAELELTEDQLRELRKEQLIAVADGDTETYYGYVRLPQGELITHSLLPLTPTWQSLLTGLSNRYSCFVADGKSRTIYYSSDAALTGTAVPEQLLPSGLQIERKCKSKFGNYAGGFAQLETGPVYCLKCETEDGAVFGLYCSVSDIVKDVAEDMITVIITLAGTFAVVLAFFFRLWKDTEPQGKKWIRVFKTDRYFEASRMRHLSSFVLFVTIIALLFSTHYMEFSAYTMQSSMAYQNLDMLAENIKATQVDKQYAVGLIECYLETVSDRMTNLFREDAALLERGALRKIAESCSINEILVYDANGYLEGSSGDYLGYRLTQNEKDAMYRVWDVLNTDTDYLFRESGENTGRYILARKRKDVPGILCFRYENPKLTGMLKYYSKDEAIRGTDFGSATTFYIKLAEDSHKTYVVEPYSTEITVTDKTVSDRMEQDNYSGIADVRGKKAYVNTRISGDISIMSAINCTQLDSMMLQYNIMLLLSFALLMLTLFCGCICKPEPVETEEEPEDAPVPGIRDRSKKTLFADATFRRMTKYFFIVLIVGYCCMMFRRTARGETLLEFIFGGAWEKKVNIFSINASIIVAVLVTVAVFVLEKLFKFIGESIGPKGVTLSNIVTSIMKFLALFAVILHALYQFGVNTAALIAGAGLTGMIIGIAAKDVFGDLIAGLFLIFEGNIRVGDFVKYKDFRGEVSEIGARVTVLKRYNRKLIVNNSDLKQYYRLSDEISSAWVEIEVGPDEDLEKIRELIDESAEWYQSRIPTLMSGPIFLNVSAFDASGITICLCGFCTEERSSSTRRKILINTIELFREHGITLGKKTMKIELAKAKEPVEIEDGGAPEEQE